MRKADQKNTDTSKDKPTIAGVKQGDKVKTKKVNTGADKPPIKAPKTKHPPKEPLTSVPVITEVNIQNLSPETEMEVHHHPQLDHNPKPWKEYLIEGFMIFIAVMMGFIAENIRESIDNNEHVRQLTSQLVNDLKADTLQLNDIYKGETRMVKYNDTLVTLLQQPLPKADIKKIQKMLANSHSMWLFHPSAGAIAAIKNELHLKQFSNSKIISYFSNYERHIELLHTDQDVNLQYQRTYIDPFLTLHFTPANMVAAFDTLSQPTAQIRNLNQDALNQLAADMVLVRIISNELLTDNRKAKKDAVDMLKYITKQYGLDD